MTRTAAWKLVPWRRPAILFLVGANLFAQTKNADVPKPPAPQPRPAVVVPQTTVATPNRPAPNYAAPNYTAPNYNGANIQQSLNQYNQIYNQIDPNLRNQVISPQALQRMLNDSSPASMQPLVNQYRQTYNQISPQDRSGLINPDVLDRMLREDNSAPPEMKTIGGDANTPDFAQGAPAEAVNALDRINAMSPAAGLDSLRGDPAKPTSGCSPEVQAQIDALQQKNDSLRQGLVDMDQGADMVNAQAGAGDDARFYGNVVGVLQGVKAVSDAAVGLFGALGGKEGEELSGAYGVGQNLVSSFNAIRDQKAGTAGAKFTSAMNESIPGAGFAGALLTDDPNEKAENSFDAVKKAAKALGKSGIGDAASIASNVLSASKTLADSDGSVTGTQVAQVGGNAIQALGTGMKAIGTTGLTTGGGIFSAGGKAITTLGNYNKAIGDAFDTAAAGNDLKLQLDSSVTSNRQKIAARRAQLVDLMNQNQQQIDSLKSCVGQRLP